MGTISASGSSRSSTLTGPRSAWLLLGQRRPRGLTRVVEEIPHEILLRGPLATECAAYRAGGARFLVRVPPQGHLKSLKQLAQNKGEFPALRARIRVKRAEGASPTSTSTGRHCPSVGHHLALSDGAFSAWPLIE